VTSKVQIEKFLSEFAKISGESIVEGLVNKAAEEANIKVKIENSKIKSNLSTDQFVKLYGHIVVLFTKVYGTNLIDGVMKKVEKR